MPGISQFGDWTKLKGILAKGASSTQWESASKKAVLREALRLRTLMVRAFNRGGPEGVQWPANSPLTLEIRKAQGFGGKKPMRRTGDLRNSVTVQEEGDGVFVGFHRDVQVGDTSSASLMEIHEFGKIIAVPVTDEVRRFWLAMSIKSNGKISPLSASKQVLLIKLPPRPVVGPILEAEAANIGKNIVKDTLKGIGWGEFATLLG